MNYLAKSYPSIFTSSYIQKAEQLIGRICCDCSGLISWYTGKVLGSAQLYAAAATRHSITALENAPIGSILWKRGHVGVYIGEGYCVEEKGISYGCVKTRVKNTRFTHWLTFDYIAYENAPALPSKEKNPYPMPRAILKRGVRGDGVRWLQWELNKAGYTPSIDGIFGSQTEKYVRKFQQSCKISVDGQVGKITRSHFSF